MMPYNRKLKEKSQLLRTNSTAAEEFLWSKIRKKQIKGIWFYRQKLIGEYIADFYCPKAKLVIEVDGGYHLSRETTGNDRVRDEYVTSLGLKVLRFNNRQVLTDISSVLEIIEREMVE
jgi:very-short-patch-repair endonuclease